MYDFCLSNNEGEFSGLFIFLYLYIPIPQISIDNYKSMNNTYDFCVIVTKPYMKLSKNMSIIRMFCWNKFRTKNKRYKIQVSD